MGLFNNKPKRLKPRVITLAKAIEYAKDPEYYRLYEFEPVDPNDLQAGYIPRLKQNVFREEMEKTKRNQSFIDRIEQGGAFKGLRQRASNDSSNDRPKYGDYKSAKKYEGDIR